MPSSSPPSSTKRCAVTIRPLRAADRDPLARILEATGAFLPAELAVALELIDLGVTGADPDYRFHVAESEERVVGYTCFGHNPMTDAVWDLYWIAVDPACHGQGVGQALLAAAERETASHGGRMLIIETDSKPSYAATRRFYLAAGYAEVARIPDYYSVGCDKVVYSRRLGNVPSPA